MNLTRQQQLFLAVVAVVVVYLALTRHVIDRDSAVFFGVLLPSIILHEISHGAVALIFGDDTAKRAGRLTLNPIAHIDPFGTVILPAILVLAHAPAFGYAKPVPVNVRNLRNPRNHGLLVGLAGPATNLVLTALATVAYRVYRPHGLARDILLDLGLANVILAVFNLIPLPPLDGSSVLERLMPASWWPGYLRFRQYSMGLLLLVFLMLPQLFGRILEPVITTWVRLVT